MQSTLLVSDPLPFYEKKWAGGNYSLFIIASSVSERMQRKSTLLHFQQHSIPVWVPTTAKLTSSISTLPKNACHTKGWRLSCTHVMNNEAESGYPGGMQAGMGK